MPTSLPPARCTDEARLAAALRCHDLRLNAGQQRRLAWLAADRMPAAVWSDAASPIAGCRLVIAAQPPTGSRLALFERAMAPDAIVVIAHAEDSEFDALKSRLVGYGTVGAAGAEGPHQLWWGGRDFRGCGWPLHGGHDPLVVSPTPAGASLQFLRGDGPAATGRRDVAAPATRAAASADSPATKASHILAAWQTSNRPILWIDSTAEISDADIVPNITAGDFAVSKRDRWLFESRILYFGRTRAAAALLRTWTDFCRRYPAVGEDYLLDQAWCLITSQMSLDTIWLPPLRMPDGSTSNASAGPCSLPTEDAGRRRAAELINDVADVRLKAARRCERTGAPEVLIRAPEPTSGRSIIAIIRDAHASGSQGLATTIEALADAFEADPGGFSQLEIILCTDPDELAAALASARGECKFVVSPLEPLAPGVFRRNAATAVRRPGAARLRCVGGRSVSRPSTIG